MDGRAYRVRARQTLLGRDRAAGRPATRCPRRGFRIDNAWYYSGSKETVHYRSVAANPQAVMHLEEAAKAFVVEGEVLLIDPTQTLVARLAKAWRQKYGYAPDASEHAGFLMLSPRRVFAWTAFPKDATGFRFDKP